MFDIIGDVYSWQGYFSSANAWLYIPVSSPYAPPVLGASGIMYVQDRAVPEGIQCQL